MKNNLARRDKVVFISLVDILLQFVFILLIVILFVYKAYDTLIVTQDGENKTKEDVAACVREKNKCVKDFIDFKKEHLQACMPKSKTEALKAVIFTAYSTNEVVFKGFTSDFYKYLDEKGDKAREVKASGIKLGTLFNLRDIEMVFSFIREQDCYHEFSIWPIPSINADEYSNMWGRVNNTFRRLSD